MNDQFPNSFDLGTERENVIAEVSPKGLKAKKGKTETVYPSFYIYNGPKDLAKDLQALASEAGDEGFYVMVKVIPTRTTEEKTHRDGEVEHKSSLDLEVLEICLPEEIVAEEDTEETDDADEVDGIVSAAKDLGIETGE